jgi:hypothetical protein
MGAQPNFGLQGICDREDPFIPRRRQADPLTAFPFDPYRKTKGRLCMCAGVDPLLELELSMSGIRIEMSSHDLYNH